MGADWPLSTFSACWRQGTLSMLLREHHWLKRNDIRLSGQCGATRSRASRTRDSDSYRVKASHTVWSSDLASEGVAGKLQARFPRSMRATLFALRRRRPNDPSPLTGFILPT